MRIQIMADLLDPDPQEGLEKQKLKLVPEVKTEQETQK